MKLLNERINNVNSDDGVSKLQLCLLYLLFRQQMGNRGPTDCVGSKFEKKVNNVHGTSTDEQVVSKEETKLY